MPHLIKGRKCPEKGVSAVLDGRERQTRGQMETGKKWAGGFIRTRGGDPGRAGGRVYAGPTPPSTSTSGRPTSDARIKGPRITSPIPPRERRPLRDPWPQGPPADPAPPPPPSCCLPLSLPATWHFLPAEAEAPPQLPARPVPAGRGPQTRGCPLAAGRAPPRPARPALAIPFPARRTYVRRCASRGRGSRCPRPGAGRCPWSFRVGPGHLYTQFKL